MKLYNYDLLLEELADKKFKISKNDILRVRFHLSKKIQLEIDFKREQIIRENGDYIADIEAF